MSITQDISSDPWLIRHESCEKLYREIAKALNERNAFPKMSFKFSELSATARMKLKQLESEISDLSNTLTRSQCLTSDEEERRERLLEDLQSKCVHLHNIHKASGPTHAESSSTNWFDQDDSDVPLLVEEEENVSVSTLREQQRRILSEQDKGLENLSAIISRQKNISLAINNEVDLHNEILDDIGTRMDSTNVNINRETTAVRFISKRDNTCGYWIVIVILFMCIIGVALA